jgi:hypothetical protein
MSLSEFLVTLVGQMGDKKIQKLPGVKKRDIVLKLMIGLSKDFEIDHIISQELMLELIELVVYLAKHSEVLKSIKSRHCCLQ